MMEKWCAVGGVPTTCGWMVYPTGTGPFGCAFEGCCDYQRPKCSSPPTLSPPANIYEWVCYECGKVEKDNIPMGGHIICDECAKKSPAEMPEVNPLPLSDEDSEGTQVPKIYGRCILYARVVGDKKANSCDGCKMAGCAAKGRGK